MDFSLVAAAGIEKKARVEASKELTSLATQAGRTLLMKIAGFDHNNGRVTYCPENLLSQSDTPQERHEVIKAIMVLYGLGEKYCVAGIKIADREVRAECRRLYRETA